MITNNQKTVEVFTTSDGREFFNNHEAERHEQQIQATKTYKSVVEEFDKKHRVVETQRLGDYYFYFIKDFSTLLRFKEFVSRHIGHDATVHGIHYRNEKDREEIEKEFVGTSGKWVTYVSHYNSYYECTDYTLIPIDEFLVDLKRFKEQTDAILGKDFSNTIIAKNPIHEEDDKWYFWDEIWLDRMGPFDSEEEAEQKLQSYLDYLGRLR